MRTNLIHFEGQAFEKRRGPQGGVCAQEVLVWRLDSMGNERGMERDETIERASQGGIGR